MNACESITDMDMVLRWRPGGLQGGARQAPGEHVLVAVCLTSRAMKTPSWEFGVVTVEAEGKLHWGADLICHHWGDVAWFVPVNAFETAGRT